MIKIIVMEEKELMTTKRLKLRTRQFKNQRSTELNG